VPQGLWRHAPARMAHWPAGTTLQSLNGGAPRPAVRARAAPGQPRDHRRQRALARDALGGRRGR
jgi:hypothetical protein